MCMAMPFTRTNGELAWSVASTVTRVLSTHGVRRGAIDLGLSDWGRVSTLRLLSLPARDTTGGDRGRR